MFCEVMKHLLIVAAGLSNIHMCVRLTEWP